MIELTVTTCRIIPKYFTICTDMLSGRYGLCVYFNSLLTYYRTICKSVLSHTCQPSEETFKKAIIIGIKGGLLRKLLINIGQRFQRKKKKTAYRLNGPPNYW